MTIEFLKPVARMLPPPVKERLRSLLGMDKLSREDVARLEALLSGFPSVLSPEQSVAYLCEKNRHSFIRFGDCELRIMSGFEAFGNDYNPKLARELIEAFKSPDDRLLRGIKKPETSMNSDYWDSKVFLQVDQDRILRSVFQTQSGNTFLHARLDDYVINHLDRLKTALWQDRDVIFVVGKGGSFFYSDAFFGTCNSASFIFGPPYNAYDEYDRIHDECLRTAADLVDPVFILALGPTATVLGYALHLAGHQALDLGNFTGRYRTHFYGGPTTEEVMTQVKRRLAVDR